MQCPVSSSGNRRNGMVRCPHMNTITMEDTLEALKFNRHVIEVPEDIRVRAARSVQRMIEIG